jgi:hypothetical protein
MELSPKINLILEHKASLNKYKKIEILFCVILDHSGIKVEIINKRNYRKYSNTWRLNHSPLPGQWVTEEIRRKLNQMKMETQLTRTLGHSKSSV